MTAPLEKILVYNGSKYRPLTTRELWFHRYWQEDGQVVMRPVYYVDGQLCYWEGFAHDPGTAGNAS